MFRFSKSTVNNIGFMAAYFALESFLSRENHHHGCVVAGGLQGFRQTNENNHPARAKRRSFSISDFIKGRNMDKNINRELQNGDEIIVPE